MKNKNIKIYLGSLNNNYRCRGPFTHPLNLGFIAAYAKKFFKVSEKIDFRLFVHPEKLIEAVRNNPPDIVGLANYTWNDNLNIQMLKLIKKEFPKTTTVMGGPNFNTFDMENYFLNRPYLNYFVVNQGETGFLNLINLYAEDKLPHQNGDPVAIDNVAYYNSNQKKTIMGDITKRFKDLDIIPSAYQDGFLDEFFEDEQLIPIIETMRGCPFTCTYCAWGDDWLRASNRFSVERVISDLDYIARQQARHMKNSSWLYIADSNFGMHKKDEQIAKQIRNHYDKQGWPSTVHALWAKNSSERVINIAETLQPLLSQGVTIAYESFDPKTLKNVRRSNISLKQFNEVRGIVKAKGLKIRTDIILGLPGETLESYLNGLRTVFIQGFDYEVVTFNCRLLGGTEMSTPAYVKKHGIKTKFRMLTQGYGIYAGQTVIEHEETIVATNTITEEEILSMRPMNWFVFLYWNNGYYREALKFALLLKINPVDFFLRMIDHLSNSKDELGELFRKFQKESEEEWSDSAEELYEKYSKKDSSNKLMAEQFLKLNAKYTAKVIFDYKKQMDEKTFKILKELINERYKDNSAGEHIKSLNEVLDYCSKKTINIQEILLGNIPKRRTQTYTYNFMKWMDDGGEKPLHKYNGGIKMDFYLSKNRESKILAAAKKQKYDNSYETYMKMVEIMRKHDLFFNITSYNKAPKDSKRSEPKEVDKGIVNWTLES